MGLDMRKVLWIGVFSMFAVLLPVNVHATVSGWSWAYIPVDNQDNVILIKQPIVGDYGIPLMPEIKAVFTRNQTTHPGAGAGWPPIYADTNLLSGVSYTTEEPTVSATGVTQVKVKVDLTGRANAAQLAKLALVSVGETLFRHNVRTHLWMSFVGLPAGSGVLASSNYPYSRWSPVYQSVLDSAVEQVWD